MRKLSMPFLAGYIFFLANPEMLRAQSMTRGMVINAQTREPLRGANIYLSGTKIGTGTDINGQYQLRSIPAGGYRLVVSMIGYKTQITDIIFGPGETREIDFELKPVVYKLPEIHVLNRDKEWEENRERFTENFIGKTEWADSVKILNPEVLRFDKNWWGRLTVQALAPLRIENRTLGYRIIYYLKEFSHSGWRTRWDGEPLFKEMMPVDSAQAAYWKKNRREAFYGSLRHFLLTLLEDRLKKEGFILYNLRRSGVYNYSPKNRSHISGSGLISEGGEDYLFDLNFFGQLEIIYTKEKEERDFLRWQRNVRRSPASVQTSYLELNEHPVTVDADGEIIQPYGATQFGYFAFSRLAYLTPRQYRPEGYPE